MPHDLDRKSPTMGCAMYMVPERSKAGVSGDQALNPLRLAWRTGPPSPSVCAVVSIPR
jgi:hypothetical protein